MKHLKLLGMAVIAALSLSAFAVASAAATTLYRNEEESPLDITGSGSATPRFAGELCALDTVDCDCDSTVTTTGGSSKDESQVSDELGRRDISLL
jgi:hypothetical protein